MTDEKTTFTVRPEHTQQLDRLALEMGFIRARRGNVSRLLRYIADLVGEHGPRALAAALQPERLAEGIEEEDDAAR